MMKTASGFLLESTEVFSGACGSLNDFQNASALDDFVWCDFDRVEVAEYTILVFQFVRWNEPNHRLPLDVFSLTIS